MLVPYWFTVRQKWGSSVSKTTTTTKCPVVVIVWTILLHENHNMLYIFNGTSQLLTKWRHRREFSVSK